MSSSTNKRKRSEDNKERTKRAKLETKEAQDQIDELYNLSKSRKTIDSKLEQYIQILDAFVSTSDKEWIRELNREKKGELFEKLRSEINTNKEVVNKKGLSDSEVISNTSALSGKLFTKNVSDFIEPRKAVLQAHFGINFKSPRLTQTDEIIEFQSNYQRDQFDKCLSTSGWGTANGINAAFTAGGIGIGYGYECKHQNEHENVSNRSGTFFSRILCSVVPTALWEPLEDDVSLSKDALSKLHDIERYMSVKRDLAKAECERFLKEYGSHVYLGGTHLGGIYKIETKFESNEKRDKTVTKEMVQIKHSASVNASCSIFGVCKIGIEHTSHFEEGKAKITGKFESTDINKIQTTDSKFGGPQQVSTIPLWKLGLVPNNSTWVVVDGGKYNRPEDYTPVWELIRQQSQDFKNPADLIQFLIETWEHLSGMTTSNHDLHILQVRSAEDHLQTAIQGMIECLNSANDAVSYASTVNKVCSEVLEIQKVVGNTSIWQNALRDNRSVPKFLNRLIQQKFSSDQERDVRRFTEKLLEFADNIKFPNWHKIQLWVNKTQFKTDSVLTETQVSNINQFSELLDRFLKHIRAKLVEEKSCILPDFTVDLETGLHRW